jgi:hypothetical protein
MKKHLLVAGLAWAPFFSAYAQQPAVLVAATPGLPTMSTRADTVRAVHTMFRKHRTGGIIWASIGAAFAARIVVVAASSNSDAASSTAGGTAVGVAVLGGVPAGIGISKLARFSTTREFAVISAYEQGKALPTYVSRRLRKSYFSN